MKTSKRRVRLGDVATVLGVLALASAAATAQQAREAAITPQAAPVLPHPWRTVTPERLRDPEPGDWATYRRTYDVIGFSPLKQITKRNVGQLRSLWSYSVPDTNTWAMTPVVANGLMFFLEGGNRVVALDATNGNGVWAHERTYPEDIAIAHGYNRSRGLTLAGDTVYWGTPDAHVLAIDARTGRLLWETRTGDYKTAESHDHPGLVADGRFFIGQAGGDRAVRGKLNALDAMTGRVLWTFYTVPLPGEPASETWGTRFPPLGAAPWTTISYDSALGLVYFATGQPGPWSRSSHGGTTALYSNSIIALDAATGKMKWYFQVQPQEDWDRDTAFEVMLVDLSFNGRPRKALVQTGKAGWSVVLDRETGEFLKAFQIAHETIIKGWTADGRAINDPAMSPTAADLGTDKTFLVCPGLLGARNLNPASFSPLTRLYYTGINHSCMEGQAGVAQQLVPGRSFLGGNGRTVRAPGKDYVGEMVAFEPVSGERRWGYRAPNGAAIGGGTLSTAGGLVFGGTIDREFFALDDTKGTLLWKTRVNGDVSGAPISYEVDGRQYVAVTAGGKPLANVGLASLSNVSIPRGAGSIWVFAMPDRRDLQPFSTAVTAALPITYSGVPRVNPAARRGGAAAVPQGAGSATASSAGAGLFTAEQAARGEAVYRDSCLKCHALPDMTGNSFRAKWGTATLGDYYTKVATTMPQDMPASLPRESYAAVVAFILRSSGFIAGSAEMRSDAGQLATVRLNASP